MSAEPFVDIKAAAAFLGVPVGYLYERTSPKSPLGKVPHVKIGKYVRFRLSELEVWAQGAGNGHV
jgi:predicted DNA-binding transcriptional regulator AlpA